MVSGSTFSYNNASWGGAIYNIGGILSSIVNVSGSSFEHNYAVDGGAVIYNNGGLVNSTVKGCLFVENSAGDKETLDLDNGVREVKDNTYHSTDIAFNKTELAVKDDRTSYVAGEDVVLEFSVELANPGNYDEDILKKLGNKTIYINDEKNVTTNNSNYTLSHLNIGNYEVYYTSCGNRSNAVNFKVMGTSIISTDKQSYDYYEGIKNTITLNIKDNNCEKGTVEFSVKDDDTGYVELLSYHNVKEGYTLTTDTLAQALENNYKNLNKSYVINVTYRSNNPNVITNSTSFTLNITKQRNTSIKYDIINNTEGNVQINLTVTDTVNHSVIKDAEIKVTGDINKITTNGILTDNTLTPGTHTINIKFNENEQYKESQTTITIKVEIDKDAKIAELQNNITNLTQQLNQANEEINTLQNNITQLTEKLSEANNQIKTLNETINKLNNQLNETNKKISGKQNCKQLLLFPHLYRFQVQHVGY